MSTATQAPASVLALMAGTKSATASRKKGDPYKVTLPDLNAYTKSTVAQLDAKSKAMALLSSVTAWPILNEMRKDLEQLETQAAQAIIAQAEPLRLGESRRTKEPLSSVHINNEVRYTNSGINHQVRLPDDVIADACAAFGEERFFEFFEPIALPDKTATAEQVKAACLAAGIGCTLGFKPTKKFHEACTLSADVAAVAAQVCPSIKATMFVVGK